MPSKRVQRERGVDPATQASRLQAEAIGIQIVKASNQVSSRRVVTALSALVKANAELGIPACSEADILVGIGMVFADILGRRDEGQRSGVVVGFLSLVDKCVNSKSEATARAATEASAAAAGG